MYPLFFLSTLEVVLFSSLFTSPVRDGFLWRVDSGSGDGGGSDTDMDAGTDAGADTGAEAGTDTDTDTDAGEAGTDTDTDAGDDDWDRDKAMKAIRKRNSENKALRERLKAAEAAKAETVEGEDYKAKWEASEHARMCLQVALSAGLPHELASRLQGSTEEELWADAEKLVALVAKPGGGRPPASRPRGGPDQGPAAGFEGEDPLKDLDAFAAQIHAN